MGETAVYYEAKPKCIVHPKGLLIVSFRGFGSGKNQLTACIFVANGRFKPFFSVLYKDYQMGCIDKHLQRISL